MLLLSLILILILVNVLFLNIFGLFSDSIFYSNINTDINISWKASFGQFYDVLSQSNTTIYKVVAGDIISNADKKKYKINSKDTEQIDISVLNVNQNDGGIYKSIDFSAGPNGCCLLIITGLYIMFYFVIIQKCMWRNEFFGLSIYLEEYGVFKSEEILKTWA